MCAVGEVDAPYCDDESEQHAAAATEVVQQQGHQELAMPSALMPGSRPSVPQIGAVTPSLESVLHVTLPGIVVLEDAAAPAAELLMASGCLSMAAAGQLDPGEVPSLDPVTALAGYEVRPRPMRSGADQAGSYTHLLHRRHSLSPTAWGIVEAWLGLGTLTNYLVSLGAVVVGGVEIQTVLLDLFKQKHPAALAAADFLDPAGLATWAVTELVGKVRLFTGATHCTPTCPRMPAPAWA